MDLPVFPPDEFDTIVSYRKRLAAFLNTSPAVIAISEKVAPVNGYVLNQYQQLIPLTLLFKLRANAQQMIALVADIFKVSQDEATLLFLSQVGGRDVIVESFDISNVEKENLLARVQTKLIDIESRRIRNRQDVSAMEEDWRRLRTVAPVQMTQPNYIGEKRSLTPTFAGTNRAPTPDDLILLMDTCRATYEVPLIVGQAPGVEPIVKFSPHRKQHVRRDWFKTKKIRVATIYGIIILSTTVEKKLTLRFSYNLRRGTLFYYFDQEAGGPREMYVYLGRAFPTLDLLGRPAGGPIAPSKSVESLELISGEEEEEEENVFGVQYYFLIRGVLIERITLFELARRLPIFYRYIYMKESHHSLPKSKNPFIYFHFQDDDLPEVRIKANQTDVKVNLQAEVKSTVGDARLVRPFMAIFSHLLGMLRDYMPGVLAHYSSIIGYQFTPIVDEKEAHYQRKMAVGYQQQSMLYSTRFPEVFPEGYDFNVPVDRRPLAEPYTAGRVISQNEMYKEGFVLRCPDNFPLIRMKGDFPVCYPQELAVTARNALGGGFVVSSKFNQFIMSQRYLGLLAVSTPVARVVEAAQRMPVKLATQHGGDVFSDVRFTDWGPVAKNLRLRLISVYPETEQDVFWRMGTPKIAHSLIFSVLMAVQDPLIPNIDVQSYAYYAAWMRKQLKDVNPECCKQQLWGLSKEEIREHLLDLDRPLDSFYHYRAVEELFEVNIVVFVKSETDKESYDIEMPSHYGPFVPHIRVDRPTILLLKRSLPSDFDSANPHYEPIVKHGSSVGTLRVFGQTMSRHIREVYSFWNRVWLFDGRRTLTNVLSTWDPYEMFSRPGTVAAGIRQVIDGYGKQRGLLLRYSDGFQMSIFGPPRAPENLVAIQEAEGPRLPDVEWSDLKRILLDQPVARSVYGGRTVGVWYDALHIRRIIYIPVRGAEELVNLPVEKSPYLRYHIQGFTDPVAEYAKTKALQIKLLSILQWLFSLSQPPYDFNAWFVIGAGEYNLSGLSAQLPVEVLKEIPDSPTPWVAAIRFLSTKTTGLIQGDRIRVGQIPVGRVFVRFLQNLASAANKNLHKTPLYLSGYYRDYRDLDTTKGLVSVADWQLRMQLSETADNKIYTKIPIRVVNNKIEDSLVVTQPIIYLTPDGRPLLVLNMASLSNSTSLSVLRQEALTLAANFYRRRYGDAWVEQNLPRSLRQNSGDTPIEQGPRIQEQRPYVYYYVDKDGALLLSKGDDFTGGRMPYLEVARLHLGDNSAYILAILPL